VLKNLENAIILGNFVPCVTDLPEETKDTGVFV